MVEQNFKGDPRMKKAYEISSKMLRNRIEKQNPEDIKILENLKETDVIIVEGTYDHAQVNFELAGIPHKVITQAELSQIELNPRQILFINCPGSDIDDRGIDRVRDFVKRGGMLVTTDWVLEYVLERAFPNFVKFSGTRTTDDIVKIEIIDVPGDSLISSLIDNTDDPQWWLESSSFPITILDHEKVRVLVKSDEMKEKYGESPIVISFNRFVEN